MYVWVVVIMMSKNLLKYLSLILSSDLKFSW